MSDSNKPKIDYTATIQREGSQYVARDGSGSKRTWGDADAAPAANGRLLAEYLFHREEIASVKMMNGVTCVEIIDFSGQQL